MFLRIFFSLIAAIALTAVAVSPLSAKASVLQLHVSGVIYLGGCDLLIDFDGTATLINRTAVDESGGVHFGGNYSFEGWAHDTQGNTYRMTDVETSVSNYTSGAQVQQLVNNIQLIRLGNGPIYDVDVITHVTISPSGEWNIVDFEVVSCKTT